MKQLKTLALFTVLLTISACSASGNDTKNSGGGGETVTGLLKELQGTWKTTISGQDLFVTFTGTGLSGTFLEASGQTGFSTKGSDDTVDHSTDNIKLQLFLGNFDDGNGNMVPGYYGFGIKDGKLAYNTGDKDAIKQVGVDFSTIWIKQ